MTTDPTEMRRTLAELIRSSATPLDGVVDQLVDSLVRIEQLEKTVEGIRLRSDIALGEFAERFDLDYVSDMPRTWGETGTEFEKSSRIVPQDPLPAQDGFYGIEYTEEGLPLRWTGPTPEFSFRVLWHREKVGRGRLLLQRTPQLEHPERIIVRVDGRSVPHTMVVNASELTFAFEVPSIDRPRTTTIQVVAPRVWSPAEEPGGSADTRRLGVVFRGLTFEQE